MYSWTVRTFTSLCSIFLLTDKSCFPYWLYNCLNTPSPLAIVFSLHSLREVLFSMLLAFRLTLSQPGWRCKLTWDQTSPASSIFWKHHEIFITSSYNLGRHPDPSDLSLWRAIFPRKQSKCVDGIKRIEMTKMHLSRSLFAPIENKSNLFR